MKRWHNSPQQQADIQSQNAEAPSGPSVIIPSPLLNRRELFAMGGLTIGAVSPLGIALPIIGLFIVVLFAFCLFLLKYIYKED